MASENNEKILSNGMGAALNGACSVSALIKKYILGNLPADVLAAEINLPDGNGRPMTIGATLENCADLCDASGNLLNALINIVRPDAAGDVEELTEIAAGQTETLFRRLFDIDDIYGPDLVI